MALKLDFEKDGKNFREITLPTHMSYQKNPILNRSKRNTFATKISFKRYIS